MKFFNKEIDSSNVVDIIMSCIAIVSALLLFLMGYKIHKYIKKYNTTQQEIQMLKDNS